MQFPYDPHAANAAYYEQRKNAYRFGVVEQVILGVGSLVVTILGIRFALALLGANADNVFASFIYDFTDPLISPFYNLFSYDHPQIGISKLEGFTLVAMAIYSLLAAGIARLFAVARAD